MRPEDNAQIQIVDELRRRGLFVFHIKNQGKWSPGYGQKLKRMGRKAGMPDLEIITAITSKLPRGVVMIEVKRPPEILPSGKRSKAKPRVDKAQNEVIAELGALGIPTLVVTSVDEAVRALAALGVPFRGRAA